MYIFIFLLFIITEVGQLSHTTAMTQAVSQDTAALNNWLKGSGTKEQVTRTIYDLAYMPFTKSPSPLWQRNLRSRVSYVQLWDKATDGEHKAATYYSYDIFGNVDTLLQDMNQGSMKTTGNRFKKIIYNYDLISGKVNSVAYQKGSKDQFYHRYSYDAENRLTAVYTSIDGIYYERDATYEYYKHGPLGRTILGQQQVQGLDYAYTIQGWLKGMNSTSVSDGSFDMGGDGKIGGVNSNIARDAYGISLSYYTGDYKPINSTVKSFATTSVGNDLYNGNIKSQVVNIPQLGNAKVYGYGYDQLNRLTKVDAYNGFNNTSNTFTPISINDYKQRISYDANGNIKTFLRNGTTDGGTPLAMDNMVYSYKPGTNQLDHVSDAVAATNYSIDIDNQDTLNYSYDQIGNLTKNKAEGIDTIQWNVYGKISQIVKSSGTIISYLYDANGNRISKTIGNRSTHYVRDAQGNVMSVYTKDPSISGGDLTQTETPIYGSSRLGVNTAPVNVERSLVAIGGYTKKRGYIHYEGSNHKGTPVVIFTDKAIQHDDNGDGMVDYKTADIVSASDNYAFGSTLPGRSYKSEAMRYGFNGQMKVPEVGSDHYTATYWEYSASTGRRWNCDPKQKEYPEQSPYSTFNGNPILYNDPTGESGEVTIDKQSKTITVTSNLILYGGSANAALAKSTAKDIQDKWNTAGGKVRIGGVEYNVKFAVTGSYNKNLTSKDISKNTDIKNNYFRVEETVSGNISYMDGTGSNTGYFKLDNIKADGSTTEAHEFGHGYGLWPGTPDGHPEVYDLRGKGQPGIMYARGTLVDSQYQYDPKAPAGGPGGTINPEKRKVLQSDIDKLGLNKLRFNKDGKASLGKLTNQYHEKTK